MFAARVLSSGIVAFHDIVTYKRGSKCQIEKFWREIKHHYRHHEIIEGVNEGSLPIAITGTSMETAGLGVLFMP